jgi:hypothetical protein
MPLEVYKSSFNFNNNKATYKKNVGVWEPAFVTFGGLFF